jgi:GTP-binding protein
MQKKLTPEFICSVADFRKAPEFSQEEFCILGRSNVGKSSFISHALGRRGLARVSKKPGKTRLANFFRVDSDTIWVDMPGYGYAKASQTEKKQWSNLLSQYCSRRKNLAGGIWLLDIRHPGLDIDSTAKEWFDSLGLPVFPIATKSDKLKTSQRSKNLSLFEKLLGLPNAPVPYSVSKSSSRETFWKEFGEWRNRLR